MTRPRFISKDEVIAATPMRELIATLRAAFIDDIVAPERAVFERGTGSSILTMPAWRPDSLTGIKIVDVDTGRRPAVNAVYVLFDGVSGAPIAILDGAALTARRTAAASALASHYLSRTDARRLLMVGTGALAVHMIEAHCSVRDFEEVAVWGRSQERAAAIADSAPCGRATTRVACDLSMEVSKSDVICVATSALEPIIRGADLKPGSHLDLVGAFRPEMQEADVVSFERSKVFVDTIEGARSEAGDLLAAIETGVISFTDIEADLASLCRMDESVRAPDDLAITLFKSVGTALEDLACAELVVANLARKGA